MTELYAHQREGVAFLVARSAAMLCDEMGTGKTRQALCAALKLYRERKIDRVLVLAPAAVKISWQDELNKLDENDFCEVRYEISDQTFYALYPGGDDGPPVCIVSYALLPQKRHVEALKKWCRDGATLLICDESSFLKNRTAKQTRGAQKISSECQHCWLLTGTPIANGPLDLFGQALVMSDGRHGPLSCFKSFYHFRARYATTQPMRFGGKTFQQVTGYQNLPELTKRFAPYVLRREKKDCLDLPEKSYTIREVALNDATWRVYQELKREALLALPDEDVRPEPNAAVRLLRLCQLTSGHVGETLEPPAGIGLPGSSRDVSSEKLSWLCDALLDGELASEQAVIVWCRWRRERERLLKLLPANKLEVWQIFGGQSEKHRSDDIRMFQREENKEIRRVLIAQQHAGGYGLTLTAASTAVYLSNTFSHVDRVQSEDRMHRVGQTNKCLYIDVLAVGPRGQRTVDAHILEALRGKKDLAAMTCSAWRRVLEE